MLELDTIEMVELPSSFLSCETVQFLRTMDSTQILLPFHQCFKQWVSSFARLSWKSFSNSKLDQSVILIHCHLQWCKQLKEAYEQVKEERGFFSLW